MVKNEVEGQFHNKVNGTKDNEVKKNRPMTKREKHKAEKIKKKYRDQDDEERELRLMLLASKPAEKNKKEGFDCYYYGRLYFS